MYIQVVKAEVKPVKVTKKSSTIAQVNILIFLDLFLFLFFHPMYQEVFTFIS